MQMAVVAVCMHEYMHTYIHIPTLATLTERHHTYYIHACMHTYIHTYVYALARFHECVVAVCMHEYMDTYIHFPTLATLTERHHTYLVG